MTASNLPSPLCCPLPSTTPDMRMGPLPDLSLLLHHPNGPALSLLLLHPIPSDGAADFHALPALSLLLLHPIPPDGAADFSALVRPRGGAGPSTNLPGPRLPPQNHQPLPSDPQPPLWSPPDTSAQRAPPSIRPGPTGAQHAPPSTLHPPPSQHPPPHFSSTGGSPIDDPDGDLDDDPHADENGPFFAPLGNALGLLGGGDVEMDDGDGMELDPSHRHVISLDSPPRLVGQKWQYVGSPSPPPVEKPTFLLPRKPQTPTYHSCEAFGSAPFPSPRDTCSLAQLWDGSQCSFVIWRLTD
ncbi:hypothetical protein EV424DRAFT_1542189 [Suillus variegatus]|nr:hypothetical protein EV424DRAFT_1542189 [Suillus variegatus]